MKVCIETINSYNVFKYSLKQYMLDIEHIEYYNSLTLLTVSIVHNSLFYYLYS